MGPNEPRYTSAGDGSHRFHNDNTGSSFELRVLDHDTLEAGRIPRSGSPWILKRLDTSSTMAPLEENDGLTSKAERYAAQAESPPPMPRPG